MKSLALLVLIGLITAGILACGGETSEPTSAPSPAAAATQLPAEPTNTPAPEPTAVPTEPPAPTATPVPQATPQPEPTATSAPETTPEPSPTATSAPEPTPEPEPTATPIPEPTPEPEPTAVPDPTAVPTAEPQLPIAADLAPLGDNLRFVVYLDSATQSFFVYDADGSFKPEDIPAPPGMEIPDASAIGVLTELVPDEIYIFVLNEKQTVELAGNSYTIYPNGDYVPWK